MASGPITSWQIDGETVETVETVADFICLGSKITADGDCSHEIKRCLLLGRKVMTNLDSIFKSRDIILSTKVCLVKAMVFPVVTYGCESWTIKKAECRRIDVFELWYWRRLLRVPSTARTMAPHSSILAWKIPWAEEPGRLQSMGSLRVAHDWATSLSLFTFMHWRRQWQPTPVFLPGESQGWGSLVGCCLWGCTESDTTEATYQHTAMVWMFLSLHSPPNKFTRQNLNISCYSVRRWALGEISLWVWHPREGD